MKSKFRITTLILSVTLLSAIILSAQEHNNDHKTDKKVESKTEDHQMMKQDKNMTCGEDGKMSCCGSKEMKGHAVKEADIVHKGTIEVAKIDVNKDGKVYQDPMDWNVISDKPGDCPLCGMKLKEVTLDQAEKNLEKNGFETK